MRSLRNYKPDAMLPMPASFNDEIFQKHFNWLTSRFRPLHAFRDSLLRYLREIEANQSKVQDKDNAD